MPTHDRIFKLAFEQPSACADLVRAALPREALDALDLSTLTIEKGSFVRRDLGERFADLLCSVRARGKRLLVHLLFEHKSRPERFTALDLLANAALIWTSWRAKHAEDPVLPRIVPIVIHHGPKPWDQPRELRELFGAEDELQRAFAALDATFAIVLFDLGGRLDPESAIATFRDPLARLAVFALTVSRLRNVLDHLRRCGFELLRTVWRSRDGKALAEPVLHYIVRFLPDDTDPREFAKMVAENVSPEAEESMRTIKDVWIDEGIARGRAVGKAEGKAEGQAEGKAEGGALAILQVLRVRFGAPAEELRARIFAIRDGDALLRLVGVAASADSLETFARELRDG